MGKVMTNHGTLGCLIFNQTYMTGTIIQPAKGGMPSAGGFKQRPMCPAGAKWEMQAATIGNLSKVDRLYGT